MLVSEALRLAYRDANINVIGDQPSDDQNDEALTILNNFWRTIVGHEFGENLVDWPVPPVAGQSCIPDNLVSSNQGTTWYLQLVANVRVILALTASTTIKFPQDPRPGARVSTVDMNSSSVTLTLDGNGRMIEGQTSLVDDVTNLAGKSWIYRDDLASWELVDDLALTDELPLDPAFDDLFLTYTAIRLCGPNSMAVPPATVEAYKAALTRAKARYRQEAATAVADPRVSESRQTFPASVNGWFY